MKRALGTFAAVALASIAAAAPATATVRACHPPRHVLARRKGVAFWSIRRHSRTLIYVCAPASHRPELVVSDNNLYPSVTHIEAAGNFVGYYYYPGISDVVHLVVFDVKHARPEFSHALPAVASIYPEAFEYWLAPNGWIAEDISLGANPADPFLQEAEVLVATDDAQSYYTIDLVGFGPAGLKRDALTWKSSFGAASSVSLGPDLIPGSAPQSLSACQAITAADVAPVLGETSGLASPGQCTYASGITPGMTLTVGLQTGLTPAQQAADETALESSGWDGLLNTVGEFHEYENAATVAGVVHQRLEAFYAGTELTLDLAMPNVDAATFLGWLGDVALDRLFSVPVTRTN